MNNNNNNIFVVSTIFLAIILFITYAIVLLNIMNHFPIEEKNESYFDSPYWVGISQSLVKCLTIFQIIAAIGYVIWFVNINYSVSEKTKKIIIVANIIFFVSSIIWPFTAYYALKNKSMKSALLSSLCLWIAAISMIILLVRTFTESNETAIIGILLTSFVVVLIDGVGWTTSIINRVG